MRCTKEHEHLMIDFIKEICEKIGPRSPCSKQEEECAKYLERKLKKFCDETNIDNFYCRPGSYRAMFHWPILFYIIAIPFFFYYPIISLLLAIFVIIILVGNEIFNLEIIDIFFKKQKSSNIISKIKPLKEKKNIIILSGHHDSNWEFPVGKIFGNKVSIFMMLPIIFNPLLLIFSLLKIVIPLSFVVNLFLLIVLISPVPILIWFGIKVISKTPVMGANDNLSALAVCFTAAQYFSDPKNKLKNSELWIVSFGCEEIGLRGSKRFVSKYFDNIKDAYSINLDLVGGKDCLIHIDTKEEMGAIRLSPEICDILENASKKLNINYSKGPIMCFTDSMAFSLKKIKSASLTALLPNNNMPKFYHTTNDTIENIDPKVMCECLEICLQAIYDIDAKFS